MNKQVKIKRALLSVSDKTGLLGLGKALQKLGVEIISSGGTATFLQQNGISVQEVSNFTGAPEMLDGRLKTLHPKIHGGLLAIRDNSTHMDQMKAQKYEPIDLVVVNLYPFEETVKKGGTSEEEIIEKIDIGGPAMLRSAAKNHFFVTVIVEPSQYRDLLTEIEANGGATTLPFRKSCARRVFERTAAYDSTISQFFQKEEAETPHHYSLALEKKWPLRYGENPHQQAGFYLPAGAMSETLMEKVLQGKQLSYNNLMDVHAALDLITDFPEKYVVSIFKHTNPCGVGISKTSLLQAYKTALSGDPVSAFGGVVIFSQTLDGDTAKVVSELFTEIVIAPSFSVEALAIFEKKKNLRLLEIDLSKAKKTVAGMDIRRAGDGYLVQQRDRSMENLLEAKVVTKLKPSEVQMEALTLAWRVCKHVKSNAIVLSNSEQTLGIGAGQMSRVDSCKFASIKAQDKKSDMIVLASDAFFPFRDSIDEVAKYGVTAIVQPGGSIRDEEVIDAANEHNIAMLFTNVRHFKH